MFSRSRYDGLPVAVVVVPDGDGGEREVAYLRTRTPGDPDAMTPAAWHRVGQHDRLDLVAATYLGDVGAFWRICDANRALDPDDLVAPSAEGSVLVVPAPGT
jgi:hypothetical protein